MLTHEQFVDVAVCAIAVGFGLLLAGVGIAVVIGAIKGKK